jgi:hypothetical protein
VQFCICWHGIEIAQFSLPMRSQLKEDKQINKQDPNLCKPTA